MKHIIHSLLAAFLCLISLMINADPIQDNHIEENLPSTPDKFDQILKRDLEKYFTETKNQKVSVEYELLRKQPTQSGVAYPKFYAWVILSTSGKILEQGAVRVAVIEKEEVRVTDYLSSASIKANPLSVQEVFPALLNNTIKQRAGLVQ